MQVYIPTDEYSSPKAAFYGVVGDPEQELNFRNANITQGQGTLELIKDFIATHYVHSKTPQNENPTFDSAWRNVTGRFNAQNNYLVFQDVLSHIQQRTLYLDDAEKIGIVAWLQAQAPVPYTFEQANVHLEHASISDAGIFTRLTRKAKVQRPADSTYISALHSLRGHGKLHEYFRTVWHEILHGTHQKDHGIFTIFANSSNLELTEAHAYRTVDKLCFDTPPQELLNYILFSTTLRGHKSVPVYPNIDEQMLRYSIGVIDTMMSYGANTPTISTAILATAHSGNKWDKTNHIFPEMERHSARVRASSLVADIHPSDALGRLKLQQQIQALGVKIVTQSLLEQRRA